MINFCINFLLIFYCFNWVFKNCAFCNSLVSFFYFSELACSHAKLLSMLYKMVMRMVFESYGVEKHYQSHIDSIDHHFGFIKYSAPKENQTNVGRHAHMDKSFADILDRNDVKGLEVKTKDGEWIAFEPTPSFS